MAGAGAGRSRAGANPGARALAEGDAHALRVFVHSPDRDGLFAAIVATLDRLGLAIQHARLLDGPNATVFDTFVVLPVDPRCPVAAADIEARLSARSARRRGCPARCSALRHLRHFCIAPQVKLADSADGPPHRARRWSAPTALGRWLTSRNCCARAPPAVHDARIATFGERARPYSIN